MWSQGHLTSFHGMQPPCPPAYPVCSHICKSLLKLILWNSLTSLFGLPKSYLSSQVYFKYHAFHELFSYPRPGINQLCLSRTILCSLYLVSVCLVLLLIIYLLMHLVSATRLTSCGQGTGWSTFYIFISLFCQLTCLSFRIPGGWCFLSLWTTCNFSVALRNKQRLFSHLFFMIHDALGLL